MTSAAARRGSGRDGPVHDAADRRRSSRRRQHLAEIDRAAASASRDASAIGWSSGRSKFRDRIFLGERASADAAVDHGDLWRSAAAGARASASWILAQGMSAERPLVILSDNSIDHALFALAAMHVGVPVAAVSPAYSLMSKDFDKLKSMIALLDPGAIYVSSLKPFAAALAAIAPVHKRNDRQRRGAPAMAAISFRNMAATAETRRRGKGLRGRRTRHHREIPVHLGLDRDAEGRHQHPAHADVEPAGQGADLAVSRRSPRPIW